MNGNGNMNGNENRNENRNENMNGMKKTKGEDARLAEISAALDCEGGAKVKRAWIVNKDSTETDEVLLLAEGRTVRLFSWDTQSSASAMAWYVPSAGARFFPDEAAARRQCEANEKELRQLAAVTLANVKRLEESDMGRKEYLPEYLSAGERGYLSDRLLKARTWAARLQEFIGNGMIKCGKRRVRKDDVGVVGWNRVGCTLYVRGWEYPCDVTDEIELALVRLLFGGGVVKNENDNDNENENGNGNDNGNGNENGNENDNDNNELPF